MEKLYSTIGIPRNMDVLILVGFFPKAGITLCFPPEYESGAEEENRQTAGITAERISVGLFSWELHTDTTRWFHSKLYMLKWYRSNDEVNISILMKSI